MSPIRKTKIRRIRNRKRAEAILKALSQGQGDVYDGYRTLYGIWCSNNAAVQELRPLFRMPGIKPDGFLSVAVGFRLDVRSLAAQILPLISSEKFKAAP